MMDFEKAMKFLETAKSIGRAKGVEVFLSESVGFVGEGEFGQRPRDAGDSVRVDGIVDRNFSPDDALRLRFDNGGLDLRMNRHVRRGADQVRHLTRRAESGRHENLGVAALLHDLIAALGDGEGGRFQIRRRSSCVALMIYARQIVL